MRRTRFSICLRVLVYLVIYDSEWVSLEQLLLSLSQHPSHSIMGWIAVFEGYGSGFMVDFLGLNVECLVNGFKFKVDRFIYALGLSI